MYAYVYSFEDRWYEKCICVCEVERERERERESSETLYLLLMGMRSSRMRYLFSEELMFAMTET